MIDNMDEVAFGVEHRRGCANVAFSGLCSNAEYYTMGADLRYDPGTQVPAMSDFDMRKVFPHAVERAAEEYRLKSITPAEREANRRRLEARKRKGTSREWDTGDEAEDIILE